MAIREFKCENCNNEQTVFYDDESSVDEVKEDCEKCGSKLKPKTSAPGFVVNGKAFI
jgi:predicted nucleic acid-binding Zn ribbon protein